jgi:hypothetical protein
MPCREQGRRELIGTGLFDPRQIQVALRCFSLALQIEYRWILEKDTGWRVEIGDWRLEIREWRREKGRWKGEGGGGTDSTRRGTFGLVLASRK